LGAAAFEGEATFLGETDLVDLVDLTDLTDLIDFATVFGLLLDLTGDFFASADFLVEDFFFVTFFGDEVSITAPSGVDTFFVDDLTVDTLLDPLLSNLALVDFFGDFLVVVAFLVVAFFDTFLVEAFFFGDLTSLPRGDRGMDFDPAFGPDPTTSSDRDLDKALELVLDGDLDKDLVLSLDGDLDRGLVLSLGGDLILSLDGL